MPQSRLTDVNTACITYRTKCLMALDYKMYKNCIGALKSMNSLLPEDTDDKQYRIIFDTDEHSKKVNSAYKIVCTNKECDVEHEYDDIRFHELDVFGIDRIVTGARKVTVWVCPKCKHENKLSESRIIENFIQRPFYTRYIPDPPVNNHGLLSSLEFHNEMVEWVWLCLNNLEEAFTRFRDDNWNKGGDEYDDISIDTTFEESQTS